MQERINRAVQAMKAAQVDALVLAPGADLFYLSGFEHGHAMERLLAFVLRQDGSAQWIVPAMNVPQVERRAKSGQVVRGWSDTEGYLPSLKQAVAGSKSIAFDDEARSAFLLDLMSVAPAARLCRASDIIRGLRIRKDASELDEQRKAARQVDDVIQQAVGLCRSGRTEAEVDEDLRAALLRQDPEGAVAFTIIASGPNSALPHHETARRQIQRGEVVILDYGTRRSLRFDGPDASDSSHLYGYLSDITVTCSVGEPSDPEVRKVYRVVWEAQQAAIRAVRPGVTCEKVDHTARSVIETAGYGPFFLHRTGHGLGLSGHEPPFIRSGNREVLEEGMVFSIEPGIYLAGRFGVRLEIIVAVGKTGADLINAPTAPELPIAKHGKVQ